MKTCLIIDDIAFNRKKIRLLVESLGIKVKEANTVSKASMFFEPDNKETIEIMLVDWHMPDIDGTALIEALKKMASFNGVSTFLYSGIEGEEGREIANKIGADGYFPKNITKEKIAEAFREKGLI